MNFAARERQELYGWVSRVLVGPRYRGLGRPGNGLVRRFPPTYGPEDVAAMAAVDEAHEPLSGPATRKLLQRACYDFGNARYRRLAEISVAQL